MGRSKITKQTLKELRADLWSRQASQKKIADSKEKNNAMTPAAAQTEALDAALEEENEMSI